MSKLYDYDKDDFELSFLVPEVEEEATEQELAGVRHAMFDWAAGGADDLKDEEPQRG